MGLSTLIQIPCHHVLANEIALNLKYHIGLKQFFNINLGICIIKKLHFLFLFSTYLPMLLLKFRSGEVIGCGIWFRIQRVPTLHTFDGPLYPKKRNTWKNVMMMSSSRFFRYFFGGGRGSVKKYAVRVLVGCGIKFCIQRALPIEIWVKTQGRMSKIQTKKVFFLWYLSPNLY